MPTEVLAPGTTNASSSEITVVAGVSVNVGAYRTDGALLEPEFRGLIKRKDPDGTFSLTKFALHRERPNRVIVGAGVYVVERTGELQVDTGIQTD